MSPSLTMTRKRRAKMAKVTHSSKIHGGLERVPGKQNWIDRLPTALKNRWHSSWIYRAAKHLHYDSGMRIGRSIAVAKNAAVRGCSTGDLNWPGRQSVNPKSRAEMCAAVATWNAMRAHANVTNASNEFQMCNDLGEDMARTIDLAYIDAETRKKSLKKGTAVQHSKAPGGGGYPINNAQDVRDAARLFKIHRSRYSPDKQKKIATHIRRGAKSFGVEVNLSNTVDLATFGHEFNPGLHHRGQGGRFVNKGAKQANQPHQTTTTFSSAIRSMDIGASIDLPGGKGAVKRLQDGWQVRTGDGKYNKIFKNVSDAIGTVTSIVRSRIGVSQ